MKKIIVVAALLVAGSVHAEELKFGDLNYFLKQGQFNVGADAVVNNETSRTDKATDHNEIEAYFINSHLGYALTDKMNLTLGLDYIYSGKTEEVGKQDYNVEGLQNVKLGGNLRIVNQADAGFNFDVGAVASIKVTDYEVGTTTGKNRDGNLLEPTYSNFSQPRNALNVNARVGKKWNEANEFYLTAGLDYHMDGKYKNKASDEDVDFDSSMDYKLGAFYQYRPVMEFMMTTGLTATQYGDMDGETNNNDFTYEDRLDFQFVFNAKYLITEKLIAKFIFTHDRRDDLDITTDAADIEIDKRNSNSYGLGVDFLF